MTSDLHVVEYEEERLNGEPLEEFKGVQMRRRVLVVVERSGKRSSLDVRSEKGRISRVNTHKMHANNI